ncbi:MAG: hypothetical protein KatS3mg006_0592 [Pyrinomonadaceae bacterium]|nr:MAG: hypothetical protein KatS3mg006_0592 [Pyrinomonadaceae bacterium]
MKLNGKETIEEKIMVKDKRRFNEEGELREEGRFVDDEKSENLDAGSGQVSTEKMAEVAESESAESKSELKQKSPEVIKLENELQQERARREAAEAKLLAVQARAEELIKRMEKETAEMRERIRRSLEDRAREAQFQFLKTLLPVLDNLKLAIEHAENSETLSTENFLAGVKGTARAFEQALSSLGVEPIESIGADFTPELHEAVDTVEVEPEREGKVILEYQRGYKFGDKLLRPAKVQVGRSRK